MNKIIISEEIEIKSKIYEINGKQIMLNNKISVIE